VQADGGKECAVCGKWFIRGDLDLDRHAAAVTLRHVYSSVKTGEFTFPCNKVRVVVFAPADAPLSSLALF